MKFPKIFFDKSFITFDRTGKVEFDKNYFGFLLRSGLKEPVIFQAEEQEAYYQIWGSMLSYLLPIEAAGGIVISEQNKILMIFRRGFWDLPKGKIDPGETSDQTALREVSEETGIPLDNLTLRRLIDITYHIYPQKNQHFIKTTYWYSMNCKGSPELVPQIDEDILGIQWFSLEDALQLNSYLSIREVLLNYKKLHETNF